MKTLLGFVLLIGVFVFFYSVTDHSKESSFNPNGESKLEALREENELEKEILATQDRRLYARYLRNEKDTVIIGDSAVIIFSVKTDTVISLKGKKLPYKIGS